MTVVVYARKAKVIERRRTQCVEDAGGRYQCGSTPSRPLKQALEFGFGHGCKRNKGNIIRILMPRDFPVA